MVPDFRLAGARLLAVMRAADDLGDHLTLPHVVFDELINKFRETLQSAFDSISAKARIVKDLISGPIARSVPNIDIAQETSTYREWLTKLLKDSNVALLSYPTTDHSSLVIILITGISKS